MTRKYPFSEYRDDPKVIAAILKGQMPWQQKDLEHQRYNIPLPLLHMMEACWNRDTSTRPQSIRSIRATHLKSILGSTPPKNEGHRDILDPELVKEWEKASSTVQYEHILAICARFAMIPLVGLYL